MRKPRWCLYSGAAGVVFVNSGKSVSKRSGQQSQDGKIGKPLYRLTPVPVARPNVQFFSTFISSSWACLRASSTIVNSSGSALRHSSANRR